MTITMMMTLILQVRRREVRCVETVGRAEPITVLAKFCDAQVENCIIARPRDVGSLRHVMLHTFVLILQYVLLHCYYHSYKHGEVHKEGRKRCLLWGNRTLPTLHMDSPHNCPHQIAHCHL